MQTARKMARLTQLLSVEHEELLRMLDACVKKGSLVDIGAFEAFRRRMVRHLALEQRVLLPALGKVHRLTAELRNAFRRDHRAIAVLCVPKPNLGFVRDLQELLAWQLSAEEAPGGMFKLYDTFVRDEHRLDKALAAVPEIELPPLATGAGVSAPVHRLLKALRLNEPKAAPPPARRLPRASSA